MSVVPVRPCGSCPYRRDVPSGVWSEAEYEKLPRYDGETFEQPPGAFYCHQQDGRLCAGWVGCHDMEESLSFRLTARSMTRAEYEAVVGYVSPVPLFASGAEAAAHGLAKLHEPGEDARRAIERLLARRGLRP